jgi:hypothetical protein
MTTRRRDPPVFGWSSRPWSGRRTPGFRSKTAEMLGGDPARRAAGRAVALAWDRCVELILHGRVPVEAGAPVTDTPMGSCHSSSRCD